MAGGSTPFRGSVRRQISKPVQVGWVSETLFVVKNVLCLNELGKNVSKLVELAASKVLVHKVVFTDSFGDFKNARDAVTERGFINGPIPSA